MNYFLIYMISIGNTAKILALSSSFRADNLTAKNAEESKVRKAFALP